MKRTLLLLALLPTVLGIAAQDYKPMLVNGREWTIGRTTIFEGSDTTLITVKCLRDTIVEGKSCKVIRGRAKIEPSGTIIALSYIAYENASERKLYEWVDVVDAPFDPYNITTHKEFRVRFDFGITDFDDYSSMPVTTDSIEVKDVKYKRIIYPELAGNNRNIRIVEGIGSNFEYFAQDDDIYEVRPSDGSYFFLSKVVDNGEVIFEKEDFDAPSIAGTESVVYDATKANTAEWFDLSGVRLAEKPSTAGIYIVRYTDGTAKKIVVR